MKTYTESEENYIKALYHLGGDQPVSNGDLASRMGAKGSSVTQATKRLEAKGLVSVLPYRGVQLTTDGVQLALGILRKHRLWEVFLVEKLGFGWEEVHDIAEQLEHVQSPELADRLSAYLGSPKVDPHGDPIPLGDGSLPDDQTRPVSQCAPGNVVRVKRVEDAGLDFFKLLQAQKIELGNQYEVLSVSKFDGSIELKSLAQNESPFFLSHGLSAHIYVVDL